MQAGGGLLKTKRFGKPESSTARHSAKYCFRVSKTLHIETGLRVSFSLPKSSYFNVEDRLIAGGFHEPGETRSDEIVD